MHNGFFNINVDGFNFVESLKVMLFGMLSILAVTAVIIICTMLLNKLARKKK